jgi:hypothetical protein
MMELLSFFKIIFSRVSEIEENAGRFADEPSESKGGME